MFETGKPGRIALNGGADATSPYRIVLFEDIEAGDNFGNRVAINGFMAAVGEPDSLNGPDAVHLFRLTGSQWFEQEEKDPSGEEPSGEDPGGGDAENNLEILNSTIFRAVEEAEKLRHVGLSDYIRLVPDSAAKREVAQAPPFRLCVCLDCSVLAFFPCKD